MFLNVITIISLKFIKLNLFNLEIINSEYPHWEEDRVETEHYEHLGDIEDKKFWMNLVPPSKLEEDVVESLKSRLKLVELIIAFGSICALLVCQFEYEIQYYPNKYECKKYGETCDYQGLPVRIIVSFASLLLAGFSIYAAILNYQIKREQKKLITGKYC